MVMFRQKGSFYWASAIVLGTLLNAQGPSVGADSLAPGEAEPAYVPGPELSPSTEQLRFDQLLPEQSRTLFMDLANLGDGLIRFDTLLVSDPGIQLTLPVKTLEPGRFIRFPVTFIQTDLDTHRAEIVIPWRSPQFNLADTLRILVTATPSFPLLASPAAITWPGAYAGQEYSRFVALQNRGTRPIYFPAAVEHPAEVAVSALPQVLAPGGATSLGITWQPSDYARIETTVVIPYVMDDLQGRLLIAVSGDATQPVQLVPAILNFHGTSAGGQYQRQVALINRSNRTLILTRPSDRAEPAAGPPDDVESFSPPEHWIVIPPEIALPPGQAVDVTVRFLPQRAGSYEFEVTLQQALREAEGVGSGPLPAVNLVVRASVDLPLSCSAYTLDFGAQPVLETYMRPIQVHNTGPAPIQISLDLAGDLGVFSFPPLVFTVAPDRPLEIPVYFRPGAMIASQDTLVLRYTTFDAAHQLQVGLKGSGLDRPLVRLSGIPDLTLEEDFPGWVLAADLQTIFSDPNHQVTYLLSQPFRGAVAFTIERDGRLMLASTPNYYGSGDVSVQAVNELGHVVADTFRLTITPVNDLPRLMVDLPDMVLREDTPPLVVGRLSEIFVDPDQLLDTVTTLYTIYSRTPDDHLRLTRRGDELILEVSPNWHGGGSFVVSAKDAADTNVVAFDAFKVTILDVNDPPVVAALPDLTLVEDDTLHMDWRSYIYDADHPVEEITLRFTAVDGEPLPVDFQEQGPYLGVVRPHPDWHGEIPIRMTAMDPVGDVAGREFTLTVTSVNDPLAPFKAIGPSYKEWDHRLVYSETDTLLTFSWFSSTNPDPEDELIYTWQLLDSSRQRIVLERPGGTDTSITTEIDLSGLYHWTVMTRDNAGATAQSDTLPLWVESLAEAVEGTERELTLGIGPNYPNPFSAFTQIEYTIPGYSEVAITVYDAMGRKVRNLLSDRQYRGRYVVTWDGRDNQGRRIASGPYVAELRAGAYMAHLKLVAVH